MNTSEFPDVPDLEITIMGTWQMLRAMRHDPTDEYEDVVVEARWVDLLGPDITIGEYTMSAIEARNFAATLLLAADAIDPHHLEQQRLDSANSAFVQYLRDHPDEAA